MFLFRRTNSSGQSVKNKRMEESMKQIVKIRNIISITVLNLIQMQNLDLSDFPFHWLEIAQIEKFWLKFQNLNCASKKQYKPNKKPHLSSVGVNGIC